MEGIKLHLDAAAPGFFRSSKFFPRFFQAGSSTSRAFETKFLNRNTGHVLRSLTYFDDAENDQPLRLVTPVDWDRLKTDFRSWVKALLPKK